MPGYVTNSSSKYLKDKNLKKEILLLAQKNPQKLVQLFELEQTARIKAEKLSEIDDITELLLNRRGWRRYTKELALKLAQENTHFSLLFIDLDRLKAVDDMFTNQHGTVYIQLFAQVLYETLRQEDIKSHPQGDEFFVFLPNTSLREAKQIRQEILKNFDQKIRNLSPDHFFYEVPKVCEVGASIGIASKEWGQSELDELSRANEEERERKIGAIIKDVRKKANIDSMRIKRKKKVIREEARRRSRMRLFTSKFQVFGTLRLF